MWKVQYHQKKMRKTVECFLKKYLQKLSTKPILFNREKLSKNPKLDKYFKGIK